MDEFEVNELRRIAVNAMLSKDVYCDRTGTQSVQWIGKQLLKVLDCYDKK